MSSDQSPYPPKDDFYTSDLKFLETLVSPVIQQNEVIFQKKVTKTLEDMERMLKSSVAVMEHKMHQTSQNLTKLSKSVFFDAQFLSTVKIADYDFEANTCYCQKFHLTPLEIELWYTILLYHPPSQDEENIFYCHEDGEEFTKWTEEILNKKQNNKSRNTTPYFIVMTCLKHQFMLENHSRLLMTKTVTIYDTLKNKKGSQPYFLNVVHDKFHEDNIYQKQIESSINETLTQIKQLNSDVLEKKLEASYWNHMLHESQERQG